MIHENVVVRAGAVLARGVVLHPNVVVEAGVQLDEDVEVFPGSYLGKPPKGAGATSRAVGAAGLVRIGAGCAIGPHAVVFQDVQIGPNTLLGDGASLREQVRVGHHCILARHVTVNYNTTIGDHTKVMDLSHITGNARIGDHVFIGTLVGTTNDNNLAARRYDDDANRGPDIADHAVIGSGAMLLPGVRIGEGAVVGAQALVTRDVAARTVVMGVPAKVVRHLG